MQNIANTKEIDKKHPGSWCIPLYQGKALALKRVDGMWDFPGGTIDHGESSLQGAVRELKEEANITVPIDSLKPIGVHIIDGRYLNVFVALIDEDEFNNLKLQEEEHTEYKWISSTSEIPGKLNPPTEEFKKQGWLANLDFILSRL
jgi:8-oxo-dGTP pyrophosphatase MutT (NUDIX family)